MTTATTIFAASAPFRTIHHGRFHISVTDSSVVGGEHLVLVKGRVGGLPDVACRVTSACVTSTALDADDCDCAGQNRAALEELDRLGSGVLIYLDQEGRGNGLVAKVEALNGKAAGLDTFSAVERLGLPADARKYDAVAAIVSELGITSVRLLTNSPTKAAAIADVGVTVTGSVPCHDPRPPIGALRHLQAKAQRGHAVLAALDLMDHGDGHVG